MGFSRLKQPSRSSTLGDELILMENHMFLATVADSHTAASWAKGRKPQTLTLSPLFGGSSLGMLVGARSNVTMHDTQQSWVWLPKLCKILWVLQKFSWTSFYSAKPSAEPSCRTPNKGSAEFWGGVGSLDPWTCLLRTDFFSARTTYYYQRAPILPKFAPTCTRCAERTNPEHRTS